jgi:hypothetical protein
MGEAQRVVVVTGASSCGPEVLLSDRSARRTGHGRAPVVERVLRSDRVSCGLRLANKALRHDATQQGVLHKNRSVRLVHDALLADAQRATGTS